MGNGVSFDILVPPEVINELQKQTPFTHAEVEQILRRYGTMDQSDGSTAGIAVEDCLMMPEFTNCRFAPDIIDYHKNVHTKRIHPRDFIKICKFLCRQTPAIEKKKFLFDLFDIHKQNVLTYDSMFRIFKLFFSNAISDDHILALVFSALHHPDLTNDGEVTKEEFCEMITDNEIQERMSVDFTSDLNLSTNNAFTKDHMP